MASPGRGHNGRRLLPARAPLGFASARSRCKQLRGAGLRAPRARAPAPAPGFPSWPFRESSPPPRPYSSPPPPLVFRFGRWGRALRRPRWRRKFAGYEQWDLGGVSGGLWQRGGGRGTLKLLIWWLWWNVARRVTWRPPPPPPPRPPPPPPPSEPPPPAPGKPGSGGRGEPGGPALRGR